jgi:4-amino-4-deoxy-L-arabinose transferase-like glycosyltransferase
LIAGVYLFIARLFKRRDVALFAALLTAISPFEIFYSRKGFENQTGILLMLLGFTLLTRYLSGKRLKYFYWGAFILGLASYIYFAQAILIPILLTAFFIIFWQKFKPLNLRPLILFLLVVAPLYYLIFTNPGVRNRSSNVSIIRDQRLGERLVDKGILEKALTITGYTAGRYFSQFGPKYLFFEGLNFTEGKRDVGPLFAAAIPFLLLGIYVLARDKQDKKEKLFVLAWILIGFLPSGLTFEDYSPHRAIMAFSMLNVVAAFGMAWLFKKYGKIALLLLLILFGANLAFFLKRYTLNYPIERSEMLQYPFREIAQYAWENYDKYSTIVFDPKFGEFTPWIGTGAHYYLAFYGKYPPEKMQAEYRLGDEKKRETLFGKFSIRAVYWPTDKYLKNTLVIASHWSLPANFEQEEKDKILKIFYFKTTAPAFYAIKL